MNRSFAENSSSQGNATAPVDQYLGWGFSPCSALAIFILVVVFNGITTAMFALNTQICTPFAVYLICLLISNIFDAVVNYPPFIASGLYTLWPLNNAWCTVYLYSVYVASAVPMHSHVLIAINRIWALTWPHSYKGHHSRKTAILVCIAMWVYVHIVLLPGVVLDDLLYRVDLSQNTCYLNADAQPAWTMTIQFLVFNVPEVFILGSYPYVFYKHFNRRGRFRRPVRDVTSSRKIPQEVWSVQAAAGSRNKDTSRDTGSASNTNERGKISLAASERRSQPFLIFSLLTICIVVCWTPCNTFYTVWAFTDLSEYVATNQFVVTLYALQCVLDPILFTVALGELRRTYVKLFLKT